MEAVMRLNQVGTQQWSIKQMTDFINTKLYAEVEDLKERIVELEEANDAVSTTYHKLLAQSLKDKKRIAELERQFKPTLFWDASDTEVSHDSIEELMHLKFEDGAKVGDKVDIQRATLLPNQTYIITKTDDDDYSCEYELKEHKDDD
jgi:predicted nuclease with TOPRIM domain